MIKFTRTSLFLGMLLWGVAAAPLPCNASQVVTLRGDSEVRAAAIKLSDLFDGVPAIIDRDIAQAPPPGQSATYNFSVLGKLAEKYRLDWRANTVGDHVTVTTASTRITTQDIRAALANKIRDAGAKGDIDVAMDKTMNDINLPADQSREFAIDNFLYDPLSKRFTGDIVASTNQAVLAKVVGHAVIRRKIPVLARSMEAGTVIGASDLDWADMPDERITAAVLTDTDQLIGHELRRSATAGDMLRSNDIMAARMITRGSMVTIKVETPFMQLTAQGRALQDGAEGEVVRVTNTQSNRVVEGKVTAPGIVSVQTAQKFASVQ